MGTWKSIMLLPPAQANRYPLTVGEGGLLEIAPNWNLQCVRLG